MNEVKTTIEVLKKVQEIDRELFLAEERLRDIPGERESIRQKLEMEKVHLKELETALKSLQLKQKEKELELGQKEGQVKKLDGQLSQVKTNKEYSALQQEIASLKADNSILEEDIIRILDEVEAAGIEVKKENERLKQVEKEYHLFEEDVNQKEKKLKNDIEKYRKDRENITAKIDPEVKERYDLVVRKKQGIGLARVHGDNCGACQMKLRPQVLNEVLLESAMVTCENCSRFLYIEDEDKPASNS